MVKELGELFGWGIGILYGLTIMSYILKFINKKFASKINKYKDIRKYYTLITKYIIKYHKIFGLLTILLISAHFIIQYTNEGISITGIIAAVVMILQVILGIFLKKNEKRYIIKVHRLVALILVCFIGVHVLLA